MRRFGRWSRLVMSLWLIDAYATLLVAAEPAHVAVTLDADTARLVGDRPVTGRLFLFLSQKPGHEPRFGPDWFAPEPFFGVDVGDAQAGDTLMLDDAADGFPAPLSELRAGEYRVQALLDHNLDSHLPARGVGNFYSDVVHWSYDPDDPAPLELMLNRTVAAQPFVETDSLKEVVVRSELLSKFHGREVVERMAVVLPAGYKDSPERRYPVVYMIPGFGGQGRQLREYAAGPPAPGEGEVEFIRILLSGDCRWGHHVFANSATNGPRGDCLVQEIVPEIDARFRTVAAPTARFLTGHSSGGWSSLWVQVNYPDVFGGVWSTSPDPVDFRDWQQVDLYADPPLSLYIDEDGSRRPIARRGVTPVLWYESFARMDDVLARGGQLRSFEAVFSPLDENGRPRRLWDRRTGRIDPEVARAWQKYDIRLVLERNWRTLGPKLQGKLHVTTGSIDTYYLEGAVRRLREALLALGSDAEVEVCRARTTATCSRPTSCARCAGKCRLFT